MPQRIHRWSPGLPQDYGWLPNLIPEAWNLAWLTLPREGVYPAQAGVLPALAASLGCMGATPGQPPAPLRARLVLPARHFVAQMRVCVWDTAPPILAADPNWRKNWALRAQQARPDHPFDLNLCIDMEVHSLRAAREVMRQKGWASVFQEADS